MATKMKVKSKPKPQPKPKTPMPRGVAAPPPAPPPARTPMVIKPMAPEVALERRITTLSSQALALKVVDDRTFAVAAELVKASKLYEEEVRRFTDPVVKASHAAWQAALKMRSDLLGPRDAVEAHLKKEMTALVDARRQQQEAVERQRREEQERLEAAERERVRQEEERLRLAAEAQRATQVAQAESVGDREAAALLRQAPVEVPYVETRPVFVPDAPTVAAPHIAGVSFAQRWRAHVVSLKALAAAVVAGTQSEAVLLPNQTVLDAMAEAQKLHLRVPGVEAVSVTVSSVNAKK